MKVNFSIQDDKQTTYMCEVYLDVIPSKNSEISLEGFFSDEKEQEIFGDAFAKVSDVTWYPFDEDEPWVSIFLKEV